MNVTVELTDDTTDGEAVDAGIGEADFATWATAALSALTLPSGDYRLSIALMDEADSARLNQTWRGRPDPTNILSFPAGDMPRPDSSDHLLGDLAICPRVVLREAEQQHKTATAHFAHLTVHGILHLRGYDHETEAEAGIMEALETRVITGLGFAPPYE